MLYASCMLDLQILRQSSRRTIAAPQQMFLVPKDELVPSNIMPTYGETKRDKMDAPVEVASTYIYSQCSVVEMARRRPRCDAVPAVGI